MLHPRPHLRAGRGWLLCYTPALPRWLLCYTPPRPHLRGGWLLCYTPPPRPGGVLLCYTPRVTPPKGVLREGGMHPPRRASFFQKQPPLGGVTPWEAEPPRFLKTNQQSPSLKARGFALGGCNRGRTAGPRPCTPLGLNPPLGCIPCGGFVFCKLASPVTPRGLRPCGASRDACPPSGGKPPPEGGLAP